ncbi:DUF3094 family protein [Teredinibacter waterburyi]|jgi:Protein of unknown function (DUF3094).|uniref:DUF3094 family protein n=1 Tax=Teredinibacter waterburyi TaxID=1500538 RepID=UPI00165FC175|nr:DUF3094 family protein [Teredinibacter waterburyi]
MPELFPDDQKKVDDYLKSNVNSYERPAFRPWLLLAVIGGVLLTISVISYVVALSVGMV